MEVSPGPYRNFPSSPASNSRTRLHNSSGSTYTNQTPSHPNSQYSVFSQGGRSSGSTQNTSASSIVPPVPASNPSNPANTSNPSNPTNNQPNGNPNGGPVGASNSVINRVADKDASLFQICVSLRNRLRVVPEFDKAYQERQIECGNDADPVTVLWRTFQAGYPMMLLFNMYDPDNPLVLDVSKAPSNRRAKAAAFMFIRACVEILKFDTSECFILQDLYGNDTSGFMKVAKVVHRVTEVFIRKGVMISPTLEDGADGGALSGKRSQREYIVDELVRTERTYVQHLELLQEFRILVEQKGIITGDSIHNIFLNLNALIDFQHRFLIRVEQTNALPETEQNWGQLFLLYAPSFQVYEPYITNQKICEATVMWEFKKFKDLGGPIELQQMVESSAVLTSFLLKPFQRLAKYPLLLKELYKHGEFDEPRREDISAAMAAISAVLDRTNEALDADARRAAVKELKEQVEDWKGHRVEAFGELLLYGTFTVLKGDSQKDVEREYRMYLFERILLCCKEANAAKQKAKLQMLSKTPIHPGAHLRNGKPRLHLKGRIFMQNVTEIVSLSKPGQYTCQIFWRGDDAIEFFIIRFTSEEVMRKWQTQVESQRRLFEEQAKTHPSETQFTYMTYQGQLENPYKEDDDDDSGTKTPNAHDLTKVSSLGEDQTSQHQSGSSNSYPNSNVAMDAQGRTRSRSITKDSNPASYRGPPTPKPFNGAPLSVRTQLPKSRLGNPPENNSYFSPSVESPISSRTSSSSSVMPFPRQATPQGHWHSEDQNRFTAPIMSRNNPSNYNGSINDDSRGPPAAAYGAHPASFAQNRLRSVSSPDIQHSAVASARRTPTNAPPVPSVPSHLAYGANEINRSSNNSPMDPQYRPSSRNAQTGPGILKRPAQAQHANTFQGNHGFDNSYPRFAPSQASASRTSSPASHALDHGATSPPVMSNNMSPEVATVPSSVNNIKVRVNIPDEGSYVCLIVAMNTSWETFRDRIDAKLSRVSNISLSSWPVKLKYIDDDGEYVSIYNDEDVQNAFEAWREQQQRTANGSNEIQLYCIRSA